MKSAPKLQQFITQLAAKHDLELDRPGAYLRLDLPDQSQLVIKNIGPGEPGTRISVTHYIQVSDDWVAEPEFVLYTDGTPSEGETDWFPIEIAEFMGGWRLCAEVDRDGHLLLYDEDEQAMLAEIADKVVASNLERFGWLDHATVATEAPPKRSWPQKQTPKLEVDDVPF